MILRKFSSDRDRQSRAREQSLNQSTLSLSVKPPSPTEALSHLQPHARITQLIRRRSSVSTHSFSIRLQVIPLICISMSSLTASTIPTPATIPSVRSESQCRRQTKPTCSFPLGLRPLGLQFQPFDKRGPITHAVQMRSASTICAASLNATCAAEQTQTVTRQSSTITIAPTQGKEKSPELDDGGSGFPPRDDDDGGGGGGGGGGGWAGGFFFFGFLAFLGFLKDQESEGPYRDGRRRLENY